MKRTGSRALHERGHQGYGDRGRAAIARADFAAAKLELATGEKLYCVGPNRPFPGQSDPGCARCR